MTTPHHGADQRDHAAIHLPDHAPDRTPVRGDQGHDDPERGGGAISVPATLMILAIIIIAGLTIDGVRAVQGGARADRIAQEAARTAGQQLDLTAARQGRTALDAPAALTAGAAYLDATGIEGTVTLPSPQQVHVEVRIQQDTVLLSLVRIDTLTYTGQADAEVIGVTPGDTP